MIDFLLINDLSKLGEIEESVLFKLKIDDCLIDLLSNYVLWIEENVLSGYFLILSLFFS